MKMFFFGGKYKGSAVLFLTVATAAMVSAIALSLVKLNAASSSKLLLSKRQLQAQQYAVTEAELVKALRYQEINADTFNLATTGLLQIPGSDYYKRVTISNVTHDSGSSVDRRNVKIEIFHKSDKDNAVFSLNVPRYEREKNSYVPVGTIIGWAGTDKPTDEYGTWLELDGSGCLLYGSLMKILKDKSGFAPDLNNAYMLAADRSTVGTALMPRLPNVKGIVCPNYVKFGLATTELLNPHALWSFKRDTASALGIDLASSTDVAYKILPDHRNTIELDAHKLKYRFSLIEILRGILEDGLIGADDEYAPQQIYDDSCTTVQPKSVKVRYFMKVE